jgi:hypothetical protein
MPVRAFAVAVWLRIVADLGLYAVGSVALPASVSVSRAAGCRIGAGNTLFGFFGSIAQLNDEAGATGAT